MLSNFKETEPTVQRYSVKKVTDDRRLTERVPADPPRNWLNWKFSRKKESFWMRNKSKLCRITAVHDRHSKTNTSPTSTNRHLSTTAIPLYSGHIIASHLGGGMFSYFNLLTVPRVAVVERFDWSWLLNYKLTFTFLSFAQSYYTSTTFV